MRLTFTRLLVAATLSAAGAAMALASIGCSKLSAFAPKQVCACEAIWNDPTCPNGELGADTAVFLVPCPDGLTPKGDAGISLIPTKDVDFDEMAQATIKQIVAWTGMNLTPVTGTTKGQWRGDVAANGRSQFAQVLGCAVIKLDTNEKPDSVKGWWKSGNTGSKLRMGAPTPDPDLPDASPPPPPPPPCPNCGPCPGCPMDPCDAPVVDETGLSVTFPSDCGPVADIGSPSDVASCTPPSCPADASDSTCISCAKANCCADVAACQADPACSATATCLLTSGGLASCSSDVDSTALDLGLCLAASCTGCTAPMSNCTPSGGVCGNIGSPGCCQGTFCIPSDINSTCQ